MGSDTVGSEDLDHGSRSTRLEKSPASAPVEDRLAVEEPLEIVLHGEGFAEPEPFVVTMRTPGNDRELAAGLLFTEGVVESGDELESLETCRDPLAYDPDNRIEVALAPVAAERFRAQERERRRQWATAACGLCGKARLQEIYRRWPEIEPLAEDARPDTELVRKLPAIMRRRQPLFDATGGLHAAALFTLDGELLAVREDIGRHNAVDKLVGRALLRDELPWRERVLVVSARAGFEILQKAIMASAPVVVAVGAASSLADEAARRAGVDLWSFVRAERSNRHVDRD